MLSNCVVLGGMYVRFSELVALCEIWAGGNGKVFVE